MKKLRVLLIVFLLLLGSILVALGILYNYYSGSVSDNKQDKEVVISGTGIEIGRTLKENNLIKNELFYKIYLKLHGVDGFKAGTYLLNESMSLGDILDILQEGSSYNPN